MFNLANILSVIYDWIYGQTLLTTVAAEQNAPKPTAAHMTFRLSNITQEGEDCLGAPNTSGKATLYGNRAFVVEIQGYGAGVIQKMENLRTSLENEAVRAALEVKKVVPFDRGPVMNLTGLDDSNFEERASFEVRMRTELVLADVDVGKIAIVNGTATYLNPSISETISIESTT